MGLNAVASAGRASASAVVVAVRTAGRVEAGGAATAGAGVSAPRSALARFVEVALLPEVVHRVSATAAAIIFRRSSQSPGVEHGAEVLADEAVVSSSYVPVSVAHSVAGADPRPSAAASLVAPDVSGAAGAERGRWVGLVRRAVAQSPAVVSALASAVDVSQVGASGTGAVSAVRAARRSSGTVGPLVAVISGLS